MMVALGNDVESFGFVWLDKKFKQKHYIVSNCSYVYSQYSAFASLQGAIAACVHCIKGAPLG